MKVLGLIKGIGPEEVQEAVGGDEPKIPKCCLLLVSEAVRSEVTEKIKKKEVRKPSVCQSLLSS
jgi:hypothetical protein